VSVFNVCKVEFWFTQRSPWRNE